MTSTMLSAPFAFDREQCDLGTLPVNLEELILPLAEGLAADDNPRATLSAITDLLIAEARRIGDEARHCLSEASHPRIRRSNCR